MTGRTAKYRVLRVALWGGNRVLTAALLRGVAPRAFALLETTGRRTGELRRTPIGDGLMGDVFWLIAAHGRQSDTVRNIEADPRVRVLGRDAWRSPVWRSGTAVLMPDDDAGARSRTLPHAWDKAVGRMLETTPLTVRIDLDPGHAASHDGGS